MEVKEAIEKRRSIRKYKDKEIPEELIKELIEAARLAPSGNNAQPWKFQIVRDKETKEKLKEIGVFKQNFVYMAPIIIVCCADPEAYPKAEFDPDFDDPYEIRAMRDLSIASQNLVLRATELGLGTCYVGWANKEKIKITLGLPKKYNVLYVITVGYPDEQSTPRSRKDINEIII